MLAAQLGHGKPALGLTQYTHNLGLGETALLHWNLLVHLAEKILRPHSLNHGQDYQATKAMHVVAGFAPRRISHGVWTDGSCLSVIEPYPALWRARLGMRVDWENSVKNGRDSDLLNAELCAQVARDYQLARDRLESPTEDTPASEGWIWAPSPLFVES